MFPLIYLLILETSETILAKYRPKGVAVESGTVRGVKESDDHLVDVGGVGQVQIDGTSAFADAKKKLRHVFSSSSVVYILPKQVSVFWFDISLSDH